MKTTFYLAAAAALLMASTTAHAGSGISFEIEGQKIHIEAPRNCNSLSCLQVMNNGSAVNLKNLKGKKSGDDDEVATTSVPPPQVQQPATTVPAVQPPAPALLPAINNTAPAPIADNLQPAQQAPITDTAAPVSRERLTGLPAATNDTTARAASTTQTNPASIANNVPAVQQAAPAVQQAAPPPQAATSPLGLWATADNKGNVRIEPCGANLCGYAEKTNEKILINMKPSDSKWTGRIHDPDSGSMYDSTIAMKGPNLLKVQGCAFGGMFCGGQTWKRIS
jgi:uncharacterized protein (DUF2147 family)